MRKLRSAFGVIGLLLFITVSSCKDDFWAYYDRPDYLRGNAFEYLTERGDYTLFLEAAEIAGYTDALNGRGIYSVFAPNDEAFEKYLSSKGKSSVKEFGKDFLEVLVGYHIVEFSFNRDDFLAFSDQSRVGAGEEGDGLAYKYKTIAREQPVLMMDPTTEVEVKVFQQEKFIPVVSTRMFQTREVLDPEQEYRMFFPNVKWLGANDQLYVGNAAVTGSGIPIDNGYMYEITEVVEPLPTVYDALGSAVGPGGEEFTLFRELYDRFAYFKYDEEATREYAALGDSLFTFYHYLETGSTKDLPDIANQWTVRESNPEYEARLRTAYNCFAPSNDVLQSFVEEFFEDFGSVEDVPLLNLFYLLNAHVEDRKELILPTDIDKGLEGQYGEQWPIRRENLIVSDFCTNGLLYGVDQVFKPAVFQLLMQPLFKYNRFRTFANIAHKAGTYEQLIDPEGEFSLLIISDENLREEYGIQVDYEVDPASIDVIGNRVGIKKWRSETDKTLVDFGRGEQNALITGQIVNEYIDLTRTERVFYPTRNQFLYVYTENRQLYDQYGSSLMIENTWDYEYPEGGRGITFEVTDRLAHPERKDNIGRLLYENSGRFRNFYQALRRANLIEINPEPVEGQPFDPDKVSFDMEWLNIEQHMVFAPTDEVWDETQLPSPTDTLEYENFLKHYFISLEENDMEDYILPNYGLTGEFKTRLKKKGSLIDNVMMTISYANDKRLRVSNEAGVNAFTDEELPIFATDGVIFGLETLLKAVD